MKQLNKVEYKHAEIIPVAIKTPWGRIKNFIRRITGRPHYYIYQDDEGVYTALLVVPTKKRGGMT